MQTLRFALLQCSDAELVQMAKAVQIPQDCSSDQLALRLSRYYADFGVNLQSLARSPELYPQLQPVVQKLNEFRSKSVPPMRGPFKSHDPIWPKWGAVGTDQKTVWFHRKADATRFLKTGIIRGAVDLDIDRNR